MSNLDATASAQLPLEGKPPKNFARLLVFGGSIPRAHELPLVGRFVLGRGGDVVVDHPSVSRAHAALVLDTAITVEDLGSRNGTHARGQRVAKGERATLSSGEQFRLGDVVCIVQRETSSAAAVSSGSPMQRARELIGLVAKSDIAVLIQAETGAGKEVAARAIHEQSTRASQPFIGINCAALPEQLLESELFGYEKGAFSGATTSKPGLFEAAGAGTVFLDEIGDMPLAMQAKLLRVLEQRAVQRLGALKPKPIEARFLAATHRDLRAAVVAGRFREDLLFRLNGITVALPPLRERVDEIPALAQGFLDDVAQRHARPSAKLSDAALERLRAHSWPGNVRELRNAIERAALLAHASTVVGPEHIVIDAPAGAPSTSASVTAGLAAKGASTSSSADDERERILAALAEAGGNQTRAAEIMGYSRRTLINRLEQLGIKRPRKG